MDNIQNYQVWSRRTAIYPAGVAVQYTALGLAGEVGEICNEIKKVYRDDDGVVTAKRRADLVDEFGDVFWYLARVTDELNIDMQDVLERNIAKLEDRLARDVLSGSGGNR
tara:strand:- start:249 stop:578 length:330 start_codon:yes stop_codon:yes gene_type:complete